MVLQMNKLIKQIIFHTHDKWNIELKYREETIEFLEFALSFDKIKSEFLLKDILARVNSGSLLCAKGLINEFNKYMPVLMSKYLLIYNSNKLIGDNK